MLTDRRVQKTPANGRALLDQTQVLGREYDGGKNLGQIGGGVLFYLVDLDGLFIFVKEDLGGLLSVSREEFHFQPKKIFIKADQLILFGSAKGMTAAKQPDRFDQVGFSVGVLSIDHVDLFRR